MNKILFVDDDPSLLRGIRRSLHASGSEWEMSFVTNGREALDFLAKNSVDIVVSDYQMPGMTGLELLSQIEFSHPNVIRVMLTGQPDRVTYAQTINICHYFFWKPLKLEGFERFLARIAYLNRILSDQQLKQQLNTLTSLPILPDSYIKLTSCLDSLDSSPALLAHIAGRDIALAMQMFKLTSSASFTLEAGISTLEAAVSYLDINTVRSLYSAHHVLTSGSLETCEEFKLDRLQQHSFRVARVAEALMQKSGDADLVVDAVLGSLLFDVGRLILVHCQPQQYRQVINLSVEQKISFKEAERCLLNTDHAAVGSYLAALWGLPDRVVETIQMHNCEGLPDDSSASIIAKTVWHANRICQGDISASQEQYQLLAEDKKWSSFMRSVCPPISTKISGLPA